MRQIALRLFLLAAFSVNKTAVAIEAGVAATKCQNRFEAPKNLLPIGIKSKENLKREYPECSYCWLNRKVKKKAEALLNRPLTEKEAQALVNSYYTKRFLPKALTYLKETEEKWILKEAGFSDNEIESLLFFDWSEELIIALHAPQINLIQNILSETMPENRNNWIYINWGSNEQIPFQQGIGAVGRILQSLPVDKRQKTVLLEVPNVKTGKINQIKLNVNDINPQNRQIIQDNGENQWYKIYAGASEISKIFAAYRSERKTLSMKELNLPENTPSRSGMKGVASLSAEGWPEIKEQIAFGKAIRNLKIPPHPLKTHIEYFALKIPLHIDYIRNGIVRSALNSKKKQKTLRLLNEWEQKAQDMIQEKAVTYSWYLHFNLNLVGVISGKKTLTKNEFFRKSNSILSVFPVFLILPVIKGELGKAALSRAFANKIMPIGLVTKPTKADGLLHDSFSFALHDLGHAEIFISHLLTYEYLSKEQAMSTNNHVKFMETLSGEERELAEDHYFEKIHEDALFFDL